MKIRARVCVCVCVCVSARDCAIPIYVLSPKNIKILPFN